MALMKRCRRDKSLWELFVFAVCLKQLYGSSGLHPDVAAIRRLMGCSYNKAKRMLANAKVCDELFYYNTEKNFLVARSFTKGKLEKNTYSDKRGRTYTAYSAYCFKYRFTRTDSVKHFAISQLLRDTMLRYAIDSRQRKDASIASAHNYFSRPEQTGGLSLKRMGKVMGMHYSTASRHLRRMEGVGEIKVTRNQTVAVIDFRTGRALTDNVDLLTRKLFLSNGYLSTRDVNTYDAKGSTAGLFVNIIFNHACRHRRKQPRKLMAFAQFDL